MSYANDMPSLEKVARTDAGLASELRMSVMRLRRRLASERDPQNDLSIPVMAVLGALFRHGELTVGELAALERVQPPTMTRKVNFLEEGGYVLCTKGFEGRLPRTEFSLTDAGRRAFKKYLDHMEAIIQHARGKK